MYRYTLPFLFLLLFLGACSKDDNSFTVIGDITGLPRQEVRLVALGVDDKLVVTDSAISDEKGHFELNGSSPEPSVYQLRFQQAPEDFLLLSLQSGTVKVTGSWPGLPENYAVSGSPASSSLRQFMQIVRSHVTDLNSIMVVSDTLRAHGKDSMLASAEADMQALKVNLTRYIETYTDTTKHEANALFTVRWLNPVAEQTYINSFIGSLDRRFPGSQATKRFAERYRQSLAASQPKAIPIPTPQGPGGDAAKEISMPSPEGKVIPLSSLKGKWVLLDFWASWCGPCRQENPNVVAAYQKYKGKNFTVYGVSLDDDKDAWIKAIKNDKLTWTHVSDLKRWENVAARDYGVEGIPANFLVDPAGNVVAKDLRGPALDAKLAELIK